jgi:hypothetical protein
MRTTPLFALALAATAGMASANEFEPAIRSYLESEIRTWVNDPAIVAAIKAQNVKTASYTQADIDRLDRIWMSEVGMSDSALIQSVLGHPVSGMLRDRVAASGGRIAEIFVMDALGLNVAAAEATSDYWQGDEAKFTETFPKGPDAVHISEVEFDESTQSYAAQLSIPIVDPASGQPVGAITIGLDAQALF